VFFDLRTPEEKIIMALKMLLVKVALADIGFVLGVTEGTVLEWLRRAAQKAEEINAHLLRELPVTQVQLDEMWNFIRRKHAQQAGPDGESTEMSEDGRQWVWISFAPEFRLILAAFVGPRTFDSALQLIQRTAAVVLGVPCFFSDGFSCYLSALIAVYHTLKTFPRTGKPGRPKQPVKEPHPELVYGQVIKKKQKGRLQELVYRIRCGSQRLEALGLSISTSLLERLNLTLRHALAPLVRKSGNFCKDRIQMRRRVVLFQAFYNFARPHMSLRVPLPGQEPHAAGLLQPKWCHRTPGMAAGLTDHVWTFRELLTAKFEPINNQSGSG
jgi:IS1 family transposase